MEKDLTYTIIGCALKAHAKLGPGLLESVYQKAMMIELDNECLSAEEEIPINVIYDGTNLGMGFRIDILVENSIILELKSVAQLEKVHFKQLQTYLKLANKHIGYLINFNAESLRIGHEINRITNIHYQK